MGGKVHVESEGEGNGSKFIITMQLRVIDTMVFNSEASKLNKI